MPHATLTQHAEKPSRIKSAPFACQHVFTDVCDTVASQDIASLKSFLMWKRRQVENAIAEAGSAGRLERSHLTALKKSLVQTGSKAFLVYANKLAKSWKFSRKDKSWCYKHSCLCKRWPALGGQQRLHVEIAGTVCIGWASIGKGWGWLGDSAVSIFVWIHMVKAIQPSLILHECVPGFDVNELSSALGSGFEVQSLVFSPDDCGVPAERPRRYTLIHREASTQVIDKYTIDTFGSLCFRRVIADGNMFFVSDPQAVTIALGEALRLAGKDPSAESWRGVLTVADRCRLEEHCTVAQADFAGVGHTIRMVNVTQNPDYTGSAGSIIPTLLRKTLIWRIARDEDGTPHRKLDRPMLPLEHLAAQGLPIPALLPDGHDLKLESPISNMLSLDVMIPSTLIAMVGNSMHVVALGSVLGFFFVDINIQGLLQPAQVLVSDLLG